MVSVLFFVLFSFFKSIILLASMPMDVKSLLTKNSRLLNLVPIQKNYSTSFILKDEQALRELNSATNASRDTILNQIHSESLFDLIKLRERSIRLSLKTLDSSAYALLRDAFAFEKLRVQSISWQRSTAQVVEFVGLNDRVRRPSQWRQLKLRLDDEGNFRCYGVFHERLDLPVSFVYIKLYSGANLISNISSILQNDEESINVKEDLDSCVFYSISSPIMGLNGIEFGAKLIKAVAAEIKSEFSKISLLATFSPIPKFTAWLADPSNGYGHLANLSSDSDQINEKRNELMEACLKYLKNPGTIDPVARFHYRNGATLGQINFAADLSASSMSQSYGIQANYIYSK